MVIEALRTPWPLGVKETVMVHWAPMARPEPQVVVSAKSPGLAPEIAMLEMVWALSPLVTVIVCGALVVFRLCAEKIRPAGLSAKPSRMATLAM